MELYGKHIIRKLIVEVEYNGHTDSFALQREMVDWCHQQLIPCIDLQLQKLPDNGMVYKMDRLEIEIQIGEEDNRMAKAIEQITEQMRHRIQITVQKAEAGAIPAPTGLPALFAEALIYFLQNGHLPWWSPVKTRPAWLEELDLLVRNGFTNSARSRLTAIWKQTAVQQRIIYQVPEQVFIKLVTLVNHGIENDITVLLRILKQALAGMQTIEREAVLVICKQAIVAAMFEPDTGKCMEQLGVQLVQALRAKGYLQSVQLLAQDLPEPFIKKLLATKTTAAPMPTAEPVVAKKQDKQDTTSENILQEGIYINNAGLVIMAPFLPVLFKKLALFDEGKISDINKAVFLVQYLASGNELVAEFELGLAKILCGLEPATPVDTNILVSDVEKAEVRDVLLAAIEYWDVLKDTSPEGLQESFLLREGRLQFINNEWRLLVEQKGWDVLLQHLPWSISMLKLPWMPNLLKTEWV
jgi:hypothetical protein